MNNTPFPNATIKRLLEHPLLTVEEEVRLVRRISDGDPEASHELVRHNLRLAWHFALRVRERSGIRGNEEDLFGEAVAGLYRAAAKYELGRGGRFSTYASFYLRDALRTQQRSAGFRSAATAADRAKPVIAAWSRLERTGREAGDPEIAAELGWTERRLRSVLWRARPISLETPMTEFGRTLGELVADEATGPDVEAERDDLHGAVRRAVGSLAPEARAVIERRFGFAEKPVESGFEAFGAKRRGKRIAIRQMEKATFAELRRLLASVAA